MLDYQLDFLSLAIASGALRFGDFVLKSGRHSPYFFNVGCFATGQHLAGLAHAYAQCIQSAGIEFDCLYGPAYKGIPLAVATSLMLALEHGRNVPYAFNRKEAKDHGEGGSLVGGPMRGRVLIIDDVITAGTSVRESVAIIRSAGAEPAGVVIALDRQERGQDERSAVQEIETEWGIPVYPVVTLDDLVEYLETVGTDPTRIDAMRIYRACYGLPS